MISGLNQDISLLGKTFHFQTELSDQGGLLVRTEVFVGGKVVASRDHRIEDTGPENEDAIRLLMKDYHQQTIKTFVTRARRYHLRVPDTDPGFELPGVLANEAPAVEPSATPSPPGGVMMEPPSPTATGAIAKAIRIRRFFSRVRQRIGPPSLGADDIGVRLTSTAQALAWMIAAPLFAETRIDEQARCHLLKDQIDEWLVSARDRNQGVQIWSGVVTFSNYLGEVNDRAELMSFDQQLLVWALDEVQRDGMKPEILERLGALYGRHPRLDRMLDEPDGVSDLAWTAHLRSVLTLL